MEKEKEKTTLEEVIREEEMLLDEENNVFGVNAISVVSNPAMEDVMLFLSKETPIELKTVDEEKQILLGAVMIPEKRILRVDEHGEKFKIWFSAETIEKVSDRFMELENQNKLTLEHKLKLKGIGVSETWIVADSDKDKSAAFGLSYPVGTWVVLMKVRDPELWDAIKETTVTGFSLEGLFKAEQTELSGLEILLKIIDG